MCGMDMKKRVLVTGATNIGKAGVATIVYKWGQEFDSDIIVYDYLMQRGLPEEKYQKAIKNKGGVMYSMSEEKKSIFSIIRWVEKIIRENSYEILHINSDSAYVAAAYIYAAKKAGLSKIYVHSHCTQIDDNNSIRRKVKTVLHKICMPYVRKNTQKYLACSKVAGEWMFGRKRVLDSKYQTIYNGVEIEKYIFNENIREQYRSEMKLNDRFVIGNIGRFSYQKNQMFLIDLFYEYSHANSNAHLVLVGEGELQEEMVEKVNKLQIQDKVFFLGLRNDVPNLLSMFDVMVMPSLFEGLPVTMVEAQMASLPCVVSENITKEAKFSKSVEYVEGWEFEKWCAKIEQFRYVERRSNQEVLKDSMFNIQVAVQGLQDVLLS